jgi:hypothetical protein
MFEKIYCFSSNKELKMFGLFVKTFNSTSSPDLVLRLIPLCCLEDTTMVVPFQVRLKKLYYFFKCWNFHKIKVPSAWGKLKKKFTGKNWGTLWGRSCRILSSSSLFHVCSRNWILSLSFTSKGVGIAAAIGEGKHTSKSKVQSEHDAKGAAENLAI